MVEGDDEGMKRVKWVFQKYQKYTFVKSLLVWRCKKSSWRCRKNHSTSLYVASLWTIMLGFTPDIFMIIHVNISELSTSIRLMLSTSSLEGCSSSRKGVGHVSSLGSTRTSLVRGSKSVKATT